MLGARTVLFVGTENDPRAGAAVAAFAQAVGRFGLKWKAESRLLPLSSDDLSGAATLVLMNRGDTEAEFRSRHPEAADRAVFWSIPAGAGAGPLIEKEVAGLIAQLLGGKADAPPVPPAPPKPEPPRKVHTVKLSRETAGRKGKGVTVVSDLPLTEDALQQLATTLKNKCGTGGTAKDGRIEIQGDQRERITTELEKLGYKVKRAGG